MKSTFLVHACLLSSSLQGHENPYSPQTLNILVNFLLHHAPGTSRCQERRVEALPLRRTPKVFADWGDRLEVGKPDVGQKKRHMLLFFGFVGTGYYGLDATNNSALPTISDVLLRTLLEAGFFLPSNFAKTSRTKWQLASRTDKGVHASFAAASVKIETDLADVIEQSDNASVPAIVLSPRALGRMNAGLPDYIRFFWGTNVTKKFDARECASSRIYEYILRADLVGGDPAQLDAVLRTFEGTHPFHNFAKGLGQKSYSGTFENGSISWPMAWDAGTSRRISSAAYRSLITCRVSHKIEIAGTEYLVVRIGGTAFALNQIRKIVGAALAVTNGRIPMDCLKIALTTPFRVGVAPLAPGFPLVLGNISWFSMKPNLKGKATSVDIPQSAHAEINSFKHDVIYAHIHELYSEGLFDSFIADLRNTSDYGRFPIPKSYFDEPNLYFDELREVNETWWNHLSDMLDARKIMRREEKDQHLKDVPGGLYIQICRRYQVMPSPEVNDVVQLLKDRVKSGELKQGQPFEYYLDVIAAERLI